MKTNNSRNNSFAVLKQKEMNPMQNADPRLNVSQQQVSPSQHNNVPILPINAQNNGLSQVGPPMMAPNQALQNATPAERIGPVGGVMGPVNSPMPAGGAPVINGPVWLQNELQNLQSQQSTLQEQVKQSGVNLGAQHAALMAQQQGRVEDAVRQAQEAALQSSAITTETDLVAFDAVLQPIIDSCTKDSISTGKAWILQHSITAASNQVIAEHLLKRWI